MVRTLVLALSLLVACATPVHAEGRTVQEDYHGAAVIFGTGWMIGCEASPNIGDVCFSVLSGETTADVVMHDVSGLPVAGYIHFWGGTGPYSWDYLGTAGYFCGQMTDIEIPALTHSLIISLQETALGTVSCTNDHGAITPAATPTTGTVTATFR